MIANMDAHKLEKAIEVVRDIKRDWLDDWDNRSSDEKLAGKAVLKTFFDILFADGLTERELSHILSVNGIEGSLKISRPDELTLKRMEKINKTTGEFVAKRWI